LRTQHAELLFSKQALEETMISGYFAMLGTLSGHIDGLAMLSQHCIFTSFYHILDLRSREDLIQLIITELDYTHDSHPRIILSKALTTCGKEIRLFATTHLGKLVDSGGGVAKWATRLLVTQLYDPSLDVCRLAVRICCDICVRLELLEYLVQLRPMLDHLGEIGAPLLLGYFCGES
jgi:rapamycin-insensitive companion of mTOR